MNFAGLNWMAIFIAALLGFGFGAVWYGVLGKLWMKAAGLTQEAVKANPSPLPFIWAALANLVMAFTMAGLMAHMVVDLRHGMITAAFIWGGFLFPSLLVNYAFQMRPINLTLIDAGHWLGVLLVISAVIGYMGVAS